MLDSSPAVRDSAIELVGKYVVTRPDLAAQYLPQIGDRSTVSWFPPIVCTTSDASTSTGYGIGSQTASRQVAQDSVLSFERPRVSGRDFSQTRMEGVR